jgi:prepilin-type N-terminal cleavage/methylation domain-containing protein
MKVKSQESRVKSQMPIVALRPYSGSRLSTLGSRLSRGMTLIELLVVIVIMTTIVGAAIPLMSPSNDDRRLREAARGLNTYITGAQNRAIATKRPYGVAFKRLSQDTKRNTAGDLQNDNGVCLEVFYVEQPAPYAGFDANSRACVALHPNLRGLVLVEFVTRGTAADALPQGWDADLFPPGTIRPHDVIEINGTRYKLLTDTTNRYSDLANVTFDSATKSFYEDTNASDAKPVKIVAQPLNDSGQQINSRYDDNGLEIGSKLPPYQPPSPYWAPPAPYKIIRQPTPASEEPYQLPEGTAIDLRASGVGVGDYFYWPGLNDNSEGVIIMFAPEGRVERVSYSQFPNPNAADAFDQPVVDNIYLLVGRRENIPGPDAAADPTLNSSNWATATTDEDRAKLRQPINWLGGGSRWVVIGSQTGRIATIENAFVDPAGVIANPQAPFNTASQSTEQMRAAQILATREFTREMAHVGGR